ncbi:MAG: hypothetical protein ACRD0D_12795 [Acidimicrobiales bacterium]
MDGGSARDDGPLGAEHGTAVPPVVGKQDERTTVAHMGAEHGT